MNVQWGQSPLHYAAQEGHLDIVRILVENGASMSLRDKVSFVIIDCS